METELIDETVLEALPVGLADLHWNRLQAKVFRYLTMDRPGDMTRHIALGSLIKLGMFVPGISFEETKDILNEYSDTTEVRDHFCLDGQQRFVGYVKHKEPVPPRQPRQRIMTGQAAADGGNCGCMECVRWRQEHGVV
jgi:hypothetical protein